MLELRDIQVTRGDFILKADLAINPGTRTAVIGASGSGKSTLLSLIAGFLAPETGRVVWNGTDLTESAPGKRPISILFQDQNLFPHLTAAQNIGLGLRPDLRLDRAQQDQVAAVLAQVGLAGFSDRKPENLSGGQQSRIALARILLRARPILLLDEPFAALGPALKSEMLTLLDQITADMGTTVLMVTHDPNDARAFAPQTILVDDGVAHQPVATAALMDNPPAGLKDYLGLP
ncbi:thiamine ABC transporter ATP-binding protein [Paracoccus sp. 11-3]|uniref:Thiamine ABC transporter ATP-binding protein n=1 Tax=Paracoccus amoyensis TaxID=2760093 RepID=A0A926GCZ1_9RHOB|nr:thiamine ABC transporter ATP-binding protein [Paracoccus amoyensis]MBC9246181.1 thiamine ABC transporter ATP-binding protein [Paracoccus amoyensis]